MQHACYGQNQLSHSLVGITLVSVETFALRKAKAIQACCREATSLAPAAGDPSVLRCPSRASFDTGLTWTRAGEAQLAAERYGSCRVSSTSVTLILSRGAGLGVHRVTNRTTAPLRLFQSHRSKALGTARPRPCLRPLNSIRLVPARPCLSCNCFHTRETKTSCAAMTPQPLHLPHLLS